MQDLMNTKKLYIDTMNLLSTSSRKRVTFFIQRSQTFYLFICSVQRVFDVFTSSRVSTGMGDRWPLAFTKPSKPTQPGYPSTDRRNKYWRWLRPPPKKKQREFWRTVLSTTMWREWVGEWVSSFLTAHHHKIGHSVLQMEAFNSCDKRKDKNLVCGTCMTL